MARNIEKERGGRFWIQHAVKHAGSLRRFARKHRALTEDGKIDYEKALSAAEKIRDPSERLRRIRQVNLARTLKRLRKA